MEDTQIMTDIRDSKGRWLAPPPGSEKTRITTENARSMVQRRWEKYRRQAVKRIVEEAKSIDLSVSTGADAFGLAAAKQFAALMDSDKPVIDQLERLYKLMTGMDAEARRENAGGASGDSITGSPAALLDLLRLIEAERQAAVERARAVDGEVTDTRSNDDGM